MGVRVVVVQKERNSIMNVREIKDCICSDCINCCISNNVEAQLSASWSCCDAPRQPICYDFYFSYVCVHSWFLYKIISWSFFKNSIECKYTGISISFPRLLYPFAREKLMGWLRHQIQNENDSLVDYKGKHILYLVTPHPLSSRLLNLLWHFRFPNANNYSAHRIAPWFDAFIS